MISIDRSLFLKDFETFKKYLLPVLLKEREQEGLPSLDEEETMNLYLDLLNKHNAGKRATDSADHPTN